MSGKHPGLFLTFDLEEWTVPGERSLNSGYNKNTEFSKTGCARLLDLFRSIQATFFVTAYFAEREPKTVRLLSEQGHEVASHSYQNSNLTAMNKNQIISNIVNSSKILSDISGAPIHGFRAPKCYINRDIINILCEHNFTYDSSIHPAIVPGHYYNWNYPLEPYFMYPDNGKKRGRILEIPISVIPVVRFPISWWWMRNLGDWLVYSGSTINLLRNRNVILYFHPWEYADLPRIKGLPFHYTRGCGKAFLSRIEKLIERYRGKFKFLALKRLAEVYTNTYSA